MVNILRKTGARYLVSAGLMLAASLRAGSAYSAFFGFLELAVIFCTGQTLYETRRRTGYVLTTLFCLIYNLQYVSLMFAGSFLSRLMLENTASLSVLGDRFFLYGAVILIAVTGACLPMASWPEGRFHPGLRPAALALTVELAACLILTARYSPVFQLGVLGNDCYQHYELRRQIARQGGEAAAADGNALADAAAFDGETALTVEASELRDGASDDGSGIRRSADMGASGRGRPPRRRGSQPRTGRRRQLRRGRIFIAAAFPAAGTRMMPCRRTRTSFLSLRRGCPRASWRTSAISCLMSAAMKRCP